MYIDKHISVHMHIHIPHKVPWLLSLEMDTVTWVQILDKAFYISQSTNPIYQPFHLGRIWHKVNF